MTLTREFAGYGAQLRNPRWAVSAMSSDGALVLSCWRQYLTIPESGILRYTDAVSRWSEGNPVGSRLCIEHLQAACENNLPVRLVIATTEDEDSVNKGNASNLKVSFHSKKTHTGKVMEFDGDNLVIDFRKTSE